MGCLWYTYHRSVAWLWSWFFPPGLILQPGPAALTDGLDAIRTALA